MSDLISGDAKQVLPKRILDAIPRCESLLELGEDEIRSLSPPTAVEEDLRLAFWMEYEFSISHNVTMRLNNAMRGICTTNRLDAILSEPLKAAFLLTPPRSYELYTAGLHTKALKNIETILKEPLKYLDEDGNERMNMELAKLQKDIYQDLDKRIKGMHVQRNVNVNVTESKKIKTPAEIERELKLLDDQSE